MMKGALLALLGMMLFNATKMLVGGWPNFVNAIIAALAVVALALHARLARGRRAKHS